MIKIFSTNFQLIIKIVCAVAILCVISGIYPFHIIPTTNKGYLPDGTLEWESEEIVQINADNEIRQEFQPEREMKFESVNLVINSVNESDDSTLSIAVYDSAQNAIGMTKIDLSEIECKKKQVFPIKTPKIDEADLYSISIKVMGDASVEFFFVDGNVEKYFGTTYIDGQICEGKLLAEVHTIEYADRDIGVYCWLIGILVTVVMVIPWKKVGFFYLRVFVILDISLLVFVMSYYQKFYRRIQNISELKKIYFVFLVMAMLIILIHAFISLKGMGKKAEKCFLVSALGWGMIYLILMPPYSYPDEPTHYAQANAYVNQLTGHEERDESGQIYIRREELIDVVSFPSLDSLREYYDGCFAGSVKSGYGTMDIVNGKGIKRASVICYLPFEIGIMIARAAEMNYVWSFTLSNMIGLMCYTLIMYIAIRLVPIGKWILFLIAQFPLALSMATSFTYDLINYSLLTLFFALFCREVYDERPLTWKRGCVFLIIGVMVFPIKYAYFPFALFIALIPSKKFQCKHTSMVKAVLVVVCLIAAFSDNTVVSHMTRNNTAKKISAPEAESFDVSGLYKVKEGSWYSKDEIIGDKGNLFKYTYNTFFEHLDYYCNGMIGMKIGWGDSFIPDYIYNIWWILILFAIVGIREENYVMSRNIRIGTFTICALSFGAIYLAMLLFSTPVGYTDCPSVGARYLLPILFPLCVAMHGKKITILEGVSDELFIWGADICQIVGLIYMFVGYVAR